MPHEPLREYRDDLPGSERVGDLLGGAVPGALVATLVGVVPIAVALLVDAGLTASAIAVTWCVLVVTAAGPKPLTGSLAWLIVPLVRAAEYSVIGVVGMRADAGAGAAVFASLAVAVLHHYDIVYRLRHQHRAPPVWLRAVALGWQGRMALTIVAAVGDATIAVGYLYGGVVGAVVLSEIVVGWWSFFAKEREVSTA